MKFAIVDLMTGRVLITSHSESIIRTAFIAYTYDPKYRITRIPNAYL
jgi:hypothetical protein